MPKIEVNLPDTVTEEEVEVIKGTLINIGPSMWEIFKNNLAAFRNFLKEACKAFWWKIVDWVQKLWDRWF